MTFSVPFWPYYHLPCGNSISSFVIDIKTKEPSLCLLSVMNDFGDATFKAGSQISFEGYADDFETAITAVEFSMDGGQTWTRYETPDASISKWVYWYFTYEAKEPGEYRLDVRSRTAEGVSPLGSSVVFTVTE